MKKILIIVAVAMMASGSFATLLSEGTQELGLSGMLDFQTAQGTEFDIELFYGRFFVDNMEAGPIIGLMNNDDWTIFRIGGGIEYNFDLGTEWVPFIGGSLLYANNNGPEGTENVSAAELGAALGVKFFMTEYLAISTALNLSIATDDLYMDKNEPQNYNINIDIGLRTFF